MCWRADGVSLLFKLKAQSLQSDIGNADEHRDLDAWARGSAGLLRASGWTESSYDGWRRSQFISSRDGVVDIINAQDVPANGVVGRFIGDRWSCSTSGGSGFCRRRVQLSTLQSSINVWGAFPVTTAHPDAHVNYPNHCEDALGRAGQGTNCSAIERMPAVLSS